MKKKILVILTLLFMMPQMALAKDYYDADDKITLNDTYNGTVFQAAEKINSEATIKGIGFMAAQTVNLGGESDYGFVAGETIKFDGVVNNDLFVAGSDIVINGDIKRDVFLAGNSVTLKGNIGRTVRVYADEVILENITINKNMYIYATKINIKDNVKLLGKIKYNENAEIKGSIKDFNNETYEVEEDDYSFEDVFSNLIYGIISLLIVAFIISFLLPNIYEKLRNKELNIDNVLKDVCTGFVILFGIPFLVLLLMITVIALPVSLIMLGFYILAIYLSIIFSGYILGHYIVTKLMHKESNEYLEIVIGIITTKIGALIPFLGVLFTSIMFLYGLGLIMSLISKKNK